MGKCFRPQDGMAWNPLRDLPPNMTCPCGSGTKFKKCCLKLTKQTVVKAFVSEYERVKKIALTGKVAW